MARYKGELLRIGTQCGITDHEALEKFIEIIARREEPEPERYKLGSGEWVGLTDEEKTEFYNEVDDWDKCVDWVEAKLKEKNT